MGTSHTNPIFRGPVAAPAAWRDRGPPPHDPPWFEVQTIKSLITFDTCLFCRKQNTARRRGKSAES